MKFMMTVLAALAPGLAVAQETAPPRCDYGEVHENAPPETAQFDFLIGDYQIFLHQWQGENWSPALPGKTARWNGWYGLGGMAIVDEWFNPDPAQDPDAPRGVNVRMYDPDAQEWDMMWIATGGRQVQDLRAKVIDGVLTMWQEYPDRPNFRAEFIIDDADQWSRITYGKDDNDEWVKTFKLAAVRIPCDAE
ncbi:hypothetical protein [Hyphococcus sp.]|uniref:hypothetical protein n=1 Tax=Hyphococcus sp. TaxID=2038636 RepID=UPI003CCBE2CF